MGFRNNGLTDNAVVNYYSRAGTWLGYTLALSRSQHFGYYTEKTKSEKVAQRQMLKKIEQKLQLKKGMKVLDAGCGQGYVTNYLVRDNNVDITGITITPREVKVATKLSKKMTKGTAHFMLADYHKLPFDDNSFDEVFTVETLAHAQDVERVIKEFYRVLKPDGKLVLVEYEWDYANFSAKYKRIYNFAREYWGGYGNQFPFGWAKKLFGKTGFLEFTEEDLTNNVKPSMDRIRKLTAPIRKIVSSNEKIAKHFMNNAAGELYSLGVEEGVFHYKVFTGVKNKSNKKMVRL